MVQIQTFSEQSMGEIAAAVRQMRLQIRSLREDVNLAQLSHRSPEGFIIGNTQEQIAAQSIAGNGDRTWASGEVLIWGQSTAAGIPRGTLIEGTRVETVYNPTDSIILGDAMIYIQRHPNSGLWVVAAMPGTAVIGKTDGAITALSTTQMGSGTVSIYSSNATGALTDSGLNETAYNTTGTAVASGVFVQMKRHSQSGLLLVDVEDCS